MSDEIDEVNDIAEALNSAALENARHAPRDHILATGYCLNPACGIEFGLSEPRRLFCDADCAIEHARISKLRIKR